MAAYNTFTRSRAGRGSSRDRLYEGFSNKIAKFSLLAAAFSLWTNRGVDIGIQQLSFCQGFSLIAFLAVVHQLTVKADLVPTKTKILFRRIMWPSILMICIITISMIQASSPFDTIRFYGRWVYGLMFAYSMSIVCRKDDGFYKSLILSFLAGGALTAVFCASGYFIPSVAHIVFQDIWSKRAMGFLSHPNQLAMLYAGAVVLAFWPGLCRVHVRACILVGLLVGLLLTGSKFNMAMTILLVPMLLFWLPAREGRLAQASASVFFGVPMVAVAVAAGAYLLQQNNASYYDRIVTFVDDPSGASTTTSRFDLYSTAWTCTLDKPVFGIGAGNAKDCLPFVHAHNVFVNYMLETGIVGLCALFYFFFAVINNCMTVSRRSRRLPGTSAGKNDEYRMAALLLISVIGYILSNCSSDSMGPATMPTFWFYIGLVLVLGTTVQLRARRIPSGAGQ